MKEVGGDSGKIIFWDSSGASLFTQEIAASYRGVLEHNMVRDPADLMLGFLSASIDGRPWTGTMWTRDAGVFLRELVMWGDLEPACQAAECLIGLVRPNEEGSFTFPITSSAASRAAAASGMAPRPL